MRITFETLGEIISRLLPEQRTSDLTVEFDGESYSAEFCFGGAGLDDNQPVIKAHHLAYLDTHERITDVDEIFRRITGPVQCPMCSSRNIRTHLEDLKHGDVKLYEHQCHDCNRSFWT